MPKLHYPVWVDNGGIVGRGVLLDYKSWAEGQGRKIDPLTTHLISPDDLQNVAKSQNVVFKPNDILIVRSGFTAAIAALSEDNGKALTADGRDVPAIGVAANEAMLKWIWERQFTAVAGDMLAFEALPFQSKTHSLHEWILAGWGMPIGELFDLEALALKCKELGKWSFFFSSLPLQVPDGVASPPNGVAIL